MTPGFDELVEQLLYDVALAGAAGIKVEEVERAVTAFYKKQKPSVKESHANDGDILFSSAPPSASVTVIDEPLIDAVWFWLKKHSDIEVKDGRVSTNEERIWQAIAGHGVDHSRIAPKQFECLAVIAAHGPNGVLQPDVRRITGQAKQSVPHRTDVLAERGYITKEQVVAKATNTTLLTLRRFAKDVPGPKHAKAYQSDGKKEVENIIWHYDAWFDKAVELIKGNDNIIVVTDLLIGLGIYEDRDQTRAFRRCYDRAVESGWLRRVSAPVEGGRDGDGTDNEYLLRCLQLVRDPTEFDRLWFKKNSGPDKLSRRSETAAQVEGQVNADALGSNMNDGESDIDETEVDDFDHDDDLHATQTRSQWKPELLYNNFLYGIVDKAGPAGITSVALNEVAGGHFYRRPLDEMMLHLTDVWQHSQPSHLKHLGIVRDTTAQGTFNFRTLPNFKKAVENGRTSWKAVQSDTSKGKKKGKSQKDVALDGWRFPRLRADVLAGDGAASLLQCQAEARTSLGFDQNAVPLKRKNKKRKLDDTPSGTPSPPAVAVAGPFDHHTADISKEVATPSAHSPPAVTLLASKSSGMKRRRVSHNESIVVLDESTAPQQAADTTISSTTREETSKKNQRIGEKRLKVSKIRPPASERGLEINPPGSYPPHLLTPGPGRRKKVLVAVIRSPKLVEGLSLSSKDTSTDHQDSPGSALNPVSIEDEEAATDSQTISSSKEVLRGRPRAFIPHTPTQPSIGPMQGPNSHPSRYKTIRWTHQYRQEDDVPQEDAPQEDVPQGDEKLGPGQAILDFSSAGKSHVESSSAVTSMLERQVSMPAQSSPAEEELTEVTANTDNSGLPAGQQSQEVSVQEVEATRATSVGSQNHSRSRRRTASHSNAENFPSASFKKRSRPASVEDFDDETVQEAIRTGKLPTRKKRGRMSYFEHAQRENLLKKMAAASNAQPPSEPRTAQVTESATSIPLEQTAVVKLPVKSHIGRQQLQRIINDSGIERSEAVASTKDPMQTVTSRIEHAEGGTTVKGPDKINDLRNSGNTESLHDSALRSSARTFGIAEASSAEPSSHEEPRVSLNGVAPSTAAARTASDGFATRPSPVHDTERKSSATSIFAPAKKVQGRLSTSKTIPSEDHRLPELFTVGVADALTPTLRTYSKPGIVRNTGTIQLRRQDLVMEIVRKADGIFPGNNDIWHAFSTQWQIQHNQLPSKQAVDDTVSSLIQSGKLVKLAFLFTNTSDVEIERHILMEEKNSKTMAEAKVVQKEIIDRYPYRMLPRTVRFIESLTKETKTAQDDGKVGASGGLDDNFAPLSHTKSKKSAVNPTMYYNEFPAISNVRVKRTAEAIAVAESKTAELKKPRNLRKVANIKRRRIVLPGERHTQYDDSNESETDDEAPIDPAQAAAMNSFSVDRYTHDPTATPAKFAAPRRRTTLTQSIRKTKLPGHSFDKPSGQLSDATDSDSDRDEAAVRRILKSRKSNVVADWKQLSKAPQDLEDILGRARGLGIKTASSPDSLFWHFCTDIDSVMAFEMAIEGAGYELGSTGLNGFIIHGLNRPQTLAPVQHPTQPGAIDFIEGFLPIGKAEKLRATFPGRQPKRRRLKSARNIGPDGKWTPSVSGGFSALEFPIVGGVATNYSQHAWSPSTLPSSAPTTPYNTRFRGQGRPKLNWSNDFLDFEVTPRATVVSKKADDRIDLPRWEKDRLAVALALTNILCRGVESEFRPKWDIVAHAFAFVHDGSVLQQRWKNQSRTELGRGYVAKLEEAIREPFLEAYERRDLLSVDFNQVNKIDWPALVRWTEMNILPLDQDGQVDSIPLDRKSFRDRFDTFVDERDSAGSDKDEDSDMSASTGLQQSTLASTNQLDLNSVFEKSWIRALVVTKKECYNERQATQKLRLMGEERLSTLLKQMVQSKTIMHVHKGRQQPGRNYVLSKHVIAQFNRWPGDGGSGTFLQDLSSAWATVADHFGVHDKFELKSDATEAETMVLNNLVANGHIRVMPVLPTFSDDFNAPAGTLSKWGMGGYTHNPKLVDESLFKLTVAYTKTASFPTGHGLKAGIKRPSSPEAVLGEPGFRIPFWMDIHGNHISEIWSMVLRSILHLLVHRPGCTAVAIQRAHEYKVWAWEAELMLSWMENVGIAEKCGGSGWRASEWWFCAFMPEIAG